jgi:hypothetical protein
MKKIALPVILLIISCSTELSYSSYGDEITTQNAVDINKFLEAGTNSQEPFKLKGVVEEVCQSKGCWMKIKNDQNKSIRVTFKDYGFFVPKDIAGREVILEGDVSFTILEEDLAKHYAEDSGKQYDESMREEVSVVASGVLVVDI